MQTRSGRAVGEGLASGDGAAGDREYLQLMGCLVGAHVPVQHWFGLSGSMFRGKRDLTRSPSSYCATALHQEVQVGRSELQVSTQVRCGDKWHQLGQTSQSGRTMVVESQAEESARGDGLPGCALQGSRRRHVGCTPGLVLHKLMPACCPDQASRSPSSK